MAYADTLNALSAALGDGSGSSTGASPAPAAAAPTLHPDAPKGGYADTLSALSSVIGGAPTGTPQPQAPASANDDPPIDPSLHPLTVRRGGPLATAIPGSAPALQAAMTPQPQPVASAVPAQPAPQPAPADTPRQTIPLSDVPGDVVQSGASGLESGALGLAALPRTMHDAAQFGAQWALSKLTGQPLAAIQARDATVDKRSGADQAQAPSYDALKSGLEAVAGPLYQPKSVAGDYAHTIGEFLPGAGDAKAAAAVSGLASEAAGQATQGTGLEPFARVGAALVAGPAASLAGAAATKALAPIVAGTPGLKSLPAVKSYVDAQTGNALLKSSSDPAALRGWAAAPAAPDIVPGSPNTLAGAVGTDQGLFQAEKAARNVDNTPFNAIDTTKSEAQVAALQGIQPTGDVFAPGQMIRSRLAALDQAAQDAEDGLNAAHQNTIAQSAANQQAAVGAVADRQAATTAGLQQQAQDATAALGPTVAPGDAGAALRQSVEDAKNAARQARSSLYQAVDPDGTLALVSSPVRDAANDIVGKIDPLAAPMTADANRVFAKARTLPDVLPFNSLTAFEQDITAAMAAERRSAGETPSLMRLGQLKSAVQDAISNAADNQAAHESRMVSGGLMPADGTMQSRLHEGWDAPNDGRSAGNPSRATGTADAGLSGNGSSQGADATGAGGAAARTSRQGVGDPRLSGQAGGQQNQSLGFAPEPPAPRVKRAGPRELSLFEHLAQSGGLSRNGDVHQILDGNRFIPGFGMLVRKAGSGLSLDDALTAAKEGGYLFDPAEMPGAVGPRTIGTNDLLDLMSREASGEKQYRLGADVPKPSLGPSQFQHVQSQIHEALAENGIDSGDVERSLLMRAHALVSSGEVDDPASAFERAVMEDRDRFEAEHESRIAETGAIPGWDVPDDAGRASPVGVPPSRDGGSGAGRASRGADATFGSGERAGGQDGRGRAEARVAQPPAAPANGALTPNFDDGAAERLSAAKSAHADYAQTYRQGPVAGALKTNGFAGQYQVPDSGVMARAFHPGDRGADDLNAFLKAANNDPRAISAIQDYALNGLRAKVGPTGILKQDDISRWMTANGPAIRALNAASPGFLAGVETPGTAERTLVAAGLAHKAEMQATNAEAARQALAANDASAAATRAGIAQARSVVNDARASSAGRFDRVAGGAISSDEVQNAVGAMLRTGTTGATRMRGLVQSVQSNPAALDGLRKAGVDWMAREFVNDGDGLVSPARMIGFLKDNADVLKELYPHDQVSMFGALARDAEAGIKWRTETAIKGGSDTAKNILAHIGGKAGEAAKHISLGMVAVEAIGQGFEHGGVRGAALGGLGAAGVYLTNSLRSAGIRRVSDLYREALTNPAVARDLISKMPASADGAKLHSLARNLVRATIMAPMAARSGGQRQTSGQAPATLN